MRKIGALLLLAVLPLAGCTAQSAEAKGVSMCEDGLQYEIEQAVPAPPDGWIDADLETSDVETTKRSTDEVEAWDVRGSATVTAGDTTVTVDWTCFTQTVDGETYAAVQTIDGECSTVKLEAKPEDC